MWSVSAFGLAFFRAAFKLARMTETPSTEEPQFRLKVGVIAGVILLVALLLLFDTWRTGQPIDLPKAEHEKLECASYTPSHNGRMLDMSTKRALVKRDLRQLAERFRCVRTYSVSEGLDDVPQVARELGLRVMLGLWIGMDGPSNDREIARGLELANEYPDVVTAVIVGNEVLLRREQTAAQLGALVERVRAGTKVPVTYADVWEFWLRNPNLARKVNFITIHILPYWEDDPIDIDRALHHVQSIYKKVQDEFPDSNVFIGETGWPSAGRPRLDAVPSRINQARFLREFVAYADHAKVPYNLIEAYDQPWKRNQEGTVGGYWGLYDANGEEKFSFTDPVVADPSWSLSFIASLAGVAGFVLLGWLLRPPPSTRALAFLGIVGHAAGSLFVKQIEYMATANRSTLEWIATSAWSISGWLSVSLAAIALARWIDGVSLDRPFGISEFAHGLGHGATPKSWPARILGLSRFVFLFGLAYTCLALTYEGRGRDFPLALAGLPILLFAMLEFVARRSETRSMHREELLLAVTLLLTSGYVTYHETVVNERAVSWSLLCGLMSAAILFGQLRSFRRTLNPNERAEQQSQTA